MNDDLELNVVSFPMLDTGLGREAGYEDDFAMIEAHEKMRAELPLAIREILDDLDREMDGVFLHGRS